MKNAKHVNFDANKWGGYAACYDALNYLLPYRQLQKTVLENMGALKGKTILEAACGTGNLTKLLTERNKDEKLKIWAVDFSAEMLKRARDKCPSEQAEFLRADMNQVLPFKDNCFDKIVSVNTLYAVSDPVNLLNEFSRVMKPCGQLILVTPKTDYQNGLILKEHCKSRKPDSYWLDAHSSPKKERRLISEAIKSKKLTERMITVAEYNRAISKNAVFYFFQPNDLVKLIEKQGFTVSKTNLTYARQGILVIALKEG